MKKKDILQFISEANIVHNNKYDYSKVEYINSDTKVTIICPEHGEFKQTPAKHLSGRGCPICGREKLSQKLRSTLENFIQKANQIHNNKYDYSKTEYVNKNTKVCIICPEHGEFWQLPSNHLKGSGCPYCSKNKKYDINSFIKKAKKVHGDKYDYSKVKYKNIKSKITIICPEHGEFQQEACSHLNGCGCPLCGIILNSNARKLSKKDFIERAKRVHGDKYDYSKVEYKNYLTKVCIICPEHGEFWQTPGNHLKGEKCPFCEGSNLEKYIYDLLIKKGVSFIKEQKFEWLVNKNKLSIDYYIPSHKIAIECQGLQHFEIIDYFGGITKLKRTQENDKIKKELCEKHGIKMIYYSNLNIKFPYEVKNNEEIAHFIEHL